MSNIPFISEDTFILLKNKNTFIVNDKIKQCKVCAFCNKIENETNVFKTCSKCKISIYCSKECQKCHWFQGHKSMCKPSNPLNSYTTTKQKHCCRTLQSSLLVTYESYIQSPGLFNEIGYDILFNDSDCYWYVEDYNEMSFILTRSNKAHFEIMCSKYNWEFMSDYWKIYYGECIDGKLGLNKHK
jgi:hypothetical protein